MMLAFKKFVGHELTAGSKQHNKHIPLNACFEDTTGSGKMLAESYANCLHQLPVAPGGTAHRQLQQTCAFSKHILKGFLVGKGT